MRYRSPSLSHPSTEISPAQSVTLHTIQACLSSGRCVSWIVHAYSFDSMHIYLVGNIV